ncbi:hypothetical protein [Streptomyces sp. NPDC088915]|uniref:hypothetical protein n=1 Tax=Streptomyces sp. NPDC088915 TaxID=3365912 RepID=UPI003810B769
MTAADAGGNGSGSVGGFSPTSPRCTPLPPTATPDEMCGRLQGAFAVVVAITVGGIARVVAV